MARMDFEAPVPPYRLDVIPLTEGLDFNTATSLAKPGSLRDCLNYEFVDGAGLKRIDGTRVYDGNSRNRTDKLFFIQIPALVSADAVFSNRPWIYLASDDNTNKIPFGFVFTTLGNTTFPSYDSDDDTVDDSTIIPFVRLDCPSYADPSFASGNIKTLNSAALDITEGTFTILTFGELSADQKAAFYNSSTAVDEEGYLVYQQDSNYVASNTDGPTTDSTNPLNPVNVVWAEKQNDSLFQIADAFIVTGTSKRQIYVGDYVYIADATSPTTYEPFYVLKAENTGGWNGGTTILHMVPSFTTSISELAYKVQRAALSCQSGVSKIYLYRDQSSVGGETAAIVNGFTLDDGTTDPSITTQPRIACMYRVDSEMGALTNDTVFSVAEPATEGTLYDLTSHPVGVSSGDAEGMPLIAGGAVKAIIPTKRGSGYTTAPTFTLPASSGTAATANNASLTKTINRTYWQFVHTGWVVPFREGNKKYGYLNKIDRYKDIDGSTYSTSSSVTGLEATRYAAGLAQGVAGPDFANPQSDTRWEGNGVWKTDGGSVLEADIISAVSAADSSHVKITAATGSGSNYSSAASNRAIFRAFSGSTPLSNIPEGSSIKGIKVTCVLDSGGTITTIPTNLKMYCALGLSRDNTLGIASKQYGTKQEMISSSGSLGATLGGGAMTDKSFTAGGTNDLFSAQNIPWDELLDPGFSVGVWCETDRYATTTAFEIRLDHVFIDVYYELPSVRYYFKSTATSHGSADYEITIHGDLVDYVVTSGSLEAGDAEGYMTIVNLRTTKADDLNGVNPTVGMTTTNYSVPYYTILSNMDIYQDSGLTVKIGETSGDMTFNGFDSYRTIKQEGSRYTSVRANFFANDEYEAFYICSGAGRAGIWDGKYWSRIYAINPKQENSDTLDKPRHVGVHNFHLMLGYKSGSVLFSAPGEPSNFSAFDGAGEIGIGDKIHGFNRLQGNAFGVFCEESVHAITGTDVSNFATQILVPNEGALEYSVASFGSRVIYTSKTGITTLDQSEKYGNFLGRRLSFDVNPWLIPRITGGVGLFTRITEENTVVESGNGYICAYAVPHKNQYRLWFKDGLQLWMTLVSEDMPKFTFVRYNSYSSAIFDVTISPVIPNYVSSQASNTQSNLVLMCPDREYIYALLKSGFLDTGATYYRNTLPGVMSLDVGDGFDNGRDEAVGTNFPYRFRRAIPHYALINYQYLKNPFTVKTLRKVRLEGQSRGAAPLVVYAEDGYKTSAQEVRTTGTPISLPLTPRDEISLSFLPASTLANVAATGRVLSILIVGESKTNDAYFTTTGTDSLTSTRTTVPTPSHYLQAMLVQFEEGQEDA